MTNAILDAMARALFLGEELNLPPVLWAALRGPDGDLALARRPIPAGTWQWTSGSATSGVPILFAESTADMGMVTNVVLYDAEVGGHEIAICSIPEPIAVRKRTVIDIPVGELTATWRRLN